MTLTEIPNRLIYLGQQYELDIEIKNNMVILTYEHDPICDESFLISTLADNIDAATKKMKRLLRLEKLL